MVGNGNDAVGVIDAVNCCNRRMGATDSSSTLDFQKRDARGTELLEYVVAILTKLTDP